MRGERQLLRLGEYLVSRAGRWLPQESREERCREWAAELPAILHDPQVRFAPRRAARMLAYAADTLRGTAMTPGRSRGPIAHKGAAFELLFLAVFLAEVAVSIWDIVQAPGDAQYYLKLAWSLLSVTYFISRLARAPERVTTPLMFSSVLALEVLGIWQIVQAPGDWANYGWAVPLGLALLVLRFPRLLGGTRKVSSSQRGQGV